MHVTPRHTFKEAILGKNADVLWKIGVINAARLQVEHFGREQRGQSNRPGRADDNFSEFFPLYVIQHLENRRETQFLQFVLGQFKFANGREIFDWDVVDAQVVSRNNDRQIPVRLRARCDHSANRRRNSVDVVERVREPGASAILQGDRNFAGQFLKNCAQPFSRGRLAVKPVDVWSKNYEDRHNCAKGLYALDHVAAADLLNEFFEESKRELLGDHVRHKKCATLRLADSIQLRSEFRFYLWPREITGKLFPERHVCRLDQFENFSRQNALRDKLHFLSE